MTHTTARVAATCVAGVLTLALASCGGSTSGASNSGPSAPAASSAPAPPDNGGQATGAKVSANTASEDEIAAALERAGVSNAERWAEEVVEYRPYPADDPDLTRLRENLAKYNPGEETTNKIVSALAP